MENFQILFDVSWFWIRKIHYTLEEIFDTGSMLRNCDRVKAFKVTSNAIFFHDRKVLSD